MVTEVLFDEESINQIFNIYLAERPIIPAAELEYDSIQVPGRNSTLTRELGYLPKTFELRFNFIEPDGVKQKYREIVDWLTNRRILRFSDDSGFYRIIKQMNPQDAQNDIAEYADFIIEMETEPFWYQDAGIQVITEKTTVTNPSKIETQLKMTIKGQGICRVRVNDNQMIFTDVQEYVTVDRGTVHRNGISQNNKMSGRYPIFLPDANEIEIDEATESVELELRWCWR